MKIKFKEIHILIFFCLISAIFCKEYYYDRLNIKYKKINIFSKFTPFINFNIFEV